MITDRVMNGNKCILRQLTIEDVTVDYVSWLNNPEVNRYLETKWTEQTCKSVKEYVEQIRKSNDSYQFAIISKQDACHIGNIKIGPIHPQYHHADISYFIGNTDYWGRGIATEAIQLICQFGFEELGLHRIEAGAYELALGSQRALEKNHFTREGSFRESIFYNGSFIDVYRYGIIENEWFDRNGKRKECI